MTEATNATNAALSLVSDFNIKKTLGLLSHRYPMLLVDRVISLGPRKSTMATRNMMFNEPFLNGHFPGHLVMPGALMFEVLTQTAALLTFGRADHERKENQLYLFVSTDGACLKRQAMPDDQLVMTAELLRSKSGMWKLKVYGKVDDEVAVEAETICAVREDKSKGRVRRKHRKST